MRERFVNVDTTESCRPSRSRCPNWDRRSSCATHGCSGGAVALGLLRGPCGVPCGCPDTVPALTSWTVGKSWAIRHCAALTALDVIEKDPIASQPTPRRPRPTMDDTRRNTEHEISENTNSVPPMRPTLIAPPSYPKTMATNALPIRPPHHYGR